MRCATSWRWTARKRQPAHLEAITAMLLQGEPPRQQKRSPEAVNVYKGHAEKKVRRGGRGLDGTYRRSRARGFGRNRVGGDRVSGPTARLEGRGGRMDLGSESRPCAARGNAPPVQGHDQPGGGRYSARPSSEGGRTPALTAARKRPCFRAAGVSGGKGLAREEPGSSSGAARRGGGSTTVPGEAGAPGEDGTARRREIRAEHPSCPRAGSTRHRGPRRSPG